jgi:hypothetical protein
MQYTEENIEFMKGKCFDPRYDMKLYPEELKYRIDAIVDICTNKKILHIGCCDHLSVIDEKIENNTWLQGLLDKKCAYVQGVDNDVTAVQYCNSHNYSKIPIICGDITECQISGLEKMDYVLMAEMIEHVNNPVDFLSRTYNNFSSQGFTGKYILTAPNALGMMRRNVFKRNIERINTDHRYWFSPYTLGKIMVEAGMTPEICEFVQYAPCSESIESVQSDAILVIGH